MGRLIPAGTGLAAYKRLDPLVEDALVGSESEGEEPMVAAASEESLTSQSGSRCDTKRRPHGRRFRLRGRGAGRERERVRNA